MCMPDHIITVFDRDHYQLVLKLENTSLDLATHANQISNRRKCFN